MHSATDLSPRHTAALIFVCGCGWRGNPRSASIHTVKMHGMYPTSRYDHVECGDCADNRRPLIGSGLVTGCAMLPTYMGHP